MTTQTAPVETLEVEGDNLLHKVKEVVQEGTVRRIRILNEEDEEFIEIPLTVWRRQRPPPPSVGRHWRHRRNRHRRQDRNRARP
jgi:hypothetical protein